MIVGDVSQRDEHAMDKSAANGIASDCCQPWRTPLGAIEQQQQP